MNARAMIVLLALVVASPGCDGVEELAVEDEIWISHRSTLNEPCHPFAVNITVPPVEESTTLSKDGHRRIREGCRPYYHGIFEPGAQPGQLWILFEETDDEGDPLTPFLDRNGQPVVEFRTAIAPSLEVRPVDDGVCLVEEECKYSVEHRPVDERSRYERLDPYIMIIH